MKIVVVGAGAGGMACATRAKRVNGTAQIIILEQSQEFARGTCSLPYLLSGEIQAATFLQAISQQTLRERGIDLRLGTTAVKIHPHQRKLETSDETLFYDKLVVSTGSRPKDASHLKLCKEHDRIWRLRSIADVKKIQRQMNGQQIRRVAIIGGGYVGIEFAEALSNLGLSVRLFQRQSQLMRLVSPLSQKVVKLLEDRGIEVALESEVTEATALGEKIEIRSSSATQGRLAETFDAVGLAQGIEPDTELLALAGASLGPSGAVIVNSRGETSLSNVYACGDGVEVPNPNGGRGRWLPLATTAARLGRVCGENAAGGSRRCGSNLGSLSLRLFGQQLATVGQASDWQQSHAVEFQWGNEDNPFRRRQPGQGVLFLEPRMNRIVGLQALGPEASSLVDLVSLSIDQQMTIQDLQNQDFSYNPPLSGLWHPLYLASRKTEKNQEIQFGGHL